ncbi:rhomboid family intramembrane serine protease [Thalassococcus sp. CAU 1522]|uniref:Rhomboid family intramembrane serine protease n=1 Tax=Thalassococcus arenae TaxID=2851652 RepID=A0ABS6N7F8_9RHOB|nr:rhomboid family intramembrane serine protease [Thalassococcus arenae]MBV2359951.1 rhomboid family intramembrane serine protease [Thalassococcus arenae]
MPSAHDEPPLNPLPPVVVVLFLLIVGVEAAFSLGARGLIGGPGAVGWRLEAAETYGISGPVIGWMIETGRWPAEHLMRFVTYPFVHGTFTHALFAGVILLAMGKMVAEAAGQLVVLAVFVLAGVVGALVFGLVLDTRMVLVGAFPPVYGLIGAFTYLLWVRLGQVGAPQIRAFSLIGVLMVLQLVFGLFFDAAPGWIADLSGFAAGFGLSVVLVPGGWTRLLERLRRP